MFKVPKDAPQVKKFSANIASGGLAGTLSLCVVYSLDFARTKLANDSKGKSNLSHVYNVTLFVVLLFTDTFMYCHMSVM